MRKDLPERKDIRLKGYDYSHNGAYFITVCVKGHHQLLGRIVGCDDHIAPLSIELTDYGLIVKKYIENMNVAYGDVYIDKFVIMPNHIHMIVFLQNNRSDVGIAPYKTSIATIVRSFKALVTKNAGFRSGSVHTTTVLFETRLNIKKYGNTLMKIL